MTALKERLMQPVRRLSRAMQADLTPGTSAPLTPAAPQAEAEEEEEQQSEPSSAAAHVAEPWTYAYFFSEELQQQKSGWAGPEGSPAAEELVVAPHLSAATASTSASSTPCAISDASGTEEAEYWETREPEERDTDKKGFAQPNEAKVPAQIPTKQRRSSRTPKLSFSGKESQQPADENEKQHTDVLQAEASQLRGETQRLAEEVRVLKETQRELQLQLKQKASSQQQQERGQGNRKAVSSCPQLSQAELQLLHNTLLFGTSSDGALRAHYSDPAGTISFSKLRTTTLRLTNSSEGPVAFKMKMSAPQSYSARPTLGVLERGAEVEISIQGGQGSETRQLFQVLALPVDVAEPIPREQWSSLPKASTTRVRLKGDMPTEDSRAVAKRDNDILLLMLLCLMALIVVPAFSWLGSYLGRGLSER